MTELHQYCFWKNVRSFCSAKSFSHFFNKNISIFVVKVVKHLMSWPLNELVKLTMLWTTGPWTIMKTQTHIAWNLYKIWIRSENTIFTLTMSIKRTLRIHLKLKVVSLLTNGPTWFYLHFHIMYLQNKNQSHYDQSHKIISILSAGIENIYTSLHTLEIQNKNQSHLWSIT